MQHSPLDVLSSFDRPFFSARVTPDGIVTGGTPHCFLGHRLSPGNRPVADGIFVQWQWDGQRLVVSNDRYGIYPLYYACHDNAIHISPSIHHVLKADFPKTLDTAALAVFYRLGFFIAEDTPFEQIRILPPGSRLIWQQGNMHLERGSIETPAPANEVRSFDEAVEQYAYLFEQAIARRPPPADEFTLPISGGRDSRHILLALLKQGYRPSNTITVKMRPPSANEDLRIARMLAAELQLPHTEIDNPDSFFQANVKDIELTNFCGSGHTWLLPVASYLKDRTSTLYDGLAGSVISGGFQVNEQKLALFRAGKLTELATLLLRETGLGPFLSSTLRSRFSGELGESLAVQKLSEELARHQHARHPLVSYIFWNRTRRGVSLIPFAILADIPNVYCPYLDHDVLDFLINLDASYSVNNALHDETIRRAYPDYAHLPFEQEKVSAPLGKDYSSYYRRAVREFTGYFARHPGSLGSRLIKSERVMLMLLRDMSKRQCDYSWYLRPALYTLQLEQALNR